VGQAKVDSVLPPSPPSSPSVSRKFQVYDEGSNALRFCGPGENVTRLFVCCLSTVKASSLPFPVC
jgi:hypothetical protein